MNSNSIVSRLKELAGKAGQAIHERLGLCIELLKDKEYVAAHFGDEGNALDRLEDDCFGDLCGARSLPELLEVYRAFPEKAQWEQHRWHLGRLVAEWDRTRPKEEHGTRRAVKVKDHEDLQQQFQEASYLLNQTRRDKDAATATNEELRQKLAALERENIELRAKVEQLEKLIAGKLRAA